jgi:hypothetical protein
MDTPLAMLQRLLVPCQARYFNRLGQKLEMLQINTVIKRRSRTTKPCELLHARVEGSACGRGSRERVGANHYMPRFKNMSFRIRNGLTDESLPS